MTFCKRFIIFLLALICKYHKNILREVAKYDYGKIPSLSFAPVVSRLSFTPNPKIVALVCHRCRISATHFVNGDVAMKLKTKLDFILVVANHSTYQKRN